LGAEPPPADSREVEGEELAWQRWVVDDIGDLLAMNVDPEAEPKRDRIALAFKECVRVFTDGNVKAFADLHGLPKHTVWGWHSGHVVPQLDMLALVCYNLDVPMRRFLFDDVIVPYKGVVSGGRRLREWQGRATPRAHNWEDRRHYLESLLQEDGTTPPSMAEVARRLNQDERNLRYHLPNECRAISARYKQQLNIEKVRLERERMDRIRSAVRELHAQGINPTAQRMLPLVGGGTFYKKVFRETYKEARRELDVGIPNSGA